MMWGDSLLTKRQCVFNYRLNHKIWGNEVIPYWLKVLLYSITEFNTKLYGRDSPRTSQIVVGDDMSHNSYFSFCVVNYKVNKKNKLYLIVDRKLIIQYQFNLIFFNFRIESICWTSYNMNVLVSIKSGKQLSMSANFGMFVSLAIKKIIVNEYQLRYVCFLWKWQ